MKTFFLATKLHFKKKKLSSVISTFSTTKLNWLGDWRQKDREKATHETFRPRKEEEEKVKSIKSMTNLHRQTSDKSQSDSHFDFLFEEKTTEFLSLLKSFSSEKKTNVNECQ
jgi:hypothetical protein